MHCRRMSSHLCACVYMYVRVHVAFNSYIALVLSQEQRTWHLGHLNNMSATVLSTHEHTHTYTRHHQIAGKMWQAWRKEAPQNGRAARHSAAHLGVVLLLRPSEQFICWLTLHWSVLISLMLASARRDGLLTQCNS